MAKQVNSAITSERLGSASLHGSSDAQDDYQWNFTSIASDINDTEHHLNALEKELHRIKGNIANPLVKSVLVSGITRALKDNPRMLRSSQGIESIRISVTKTRFGRIISRTRVDRETIRTVQTGESCTRYKTTTSFIFHPASWLIRFGLRYGLEVMFTSSQSGWKYNVLPVRAVADDALIFSLCKTGNIDAVRELFGRGDASVLDVDSTGWRPLHFATWGGHLDMAKFLIMQGSDKAASGYYNNCTPAALILPKGEAIEILRLFDDCIDLSEPDSQGWTVLGGIADGRVGSENHVVTRLISFFSQKYRMSIRDGYYEPPIRYITWLSIQMSIVESVELLLNFDPQACPINDTHRTDDIEQPLVFDVVKAPHTSPDILRILMDKGADIHGAVYCGDTTTSLSLWFSYTFLHWLGRLQDIYKKLDDFILSETSTKCMLEQSGWHTGTLRTLFSLRLYETLLYTAETSLIFYMSLECIKHEFHTTEVTDWSQFIEPWWEEFKYNIKSDQCICFMLEQGDMYLDQRYFHEASPKSEAHHTFEEDFQAMPDVRPCKRRGSSIWILEEFYRRDGKWRYEYEPGEIWCKECLAEREGFYESSSEGTDTETLDESTNMECSDEEDTEEDDDSDISMW